MNTKLEYKEYPNRKKLRDMYAHRINRHLTYDQFREGIKREIDLNNQKYFTELKMNYELTKEEGAENNDRTETLR